MANYTSNQYYNIESKQGIVQLQLNYCLFLESKTYEYRDELLSLLDDLSNDKEVNVLIITNDHPDFSLEKYKQLWNSFFEGGDLKDNVLRAFRIFDQLVIRLYSLKKVVISMITGPLNSMLFNFNLISDVRVVTNEFYLDNNNEMMVNVPKGAIMYDHFKVANINPVKLLFLSDKVFYQEFLSNNLVDKVFTQEEIADRVYALAERFVKINYAEIEAAKMAKSIDNLEEFEQSLQKENAFLLACIREKLNPGSQKIHRFH
ncbi:enoyl-CoA hydratase-related protein [Plebeiibacterium sediminum]|uniref:Enoyl-CoA delta isomerase 1 n=1 Tax=Plebeiibacterium sediminum TaxID=2992112 RepID=A0AAE3SEH9_9BACT|nr:enoyl-CoA hydratase-related protein [Plebeiobacterium sediminum]MCW3786390.1 enoyl-CoA delta isomerase 1 [Plebeiobacterium sediminum]